MKPRGVAICGLGFGDEGKGSITDFLTRKHRSKLTVKTNGSANCAHNVVLADGRHHCFSQFGSGSLFGADTLLSRFFCVEPFALIEEAKYLHALGAKTNVYVDWRSLVVTPYHRLANRARESARGAGRHGSVGVGLGEAVAREENERVSLRVRDLYDRERTQSKLEALAHDIGNELNLDVTRDFAPDRLAREYEDWLSFGWLKALDEHEIFRLIELQSAPILFEGGQGVLLDQHFGSFPHVTRSRCTFSNAQELAAEWALERPRQIGVLRTYHTRHGAGPFPTEVDDGVIIKRIEAHNRTHDWQGTFREGLLDLDLVRYAATHSGPDEIALTHVDVEPPGRMALSATAHLTDVFTRVPEYVTTFCNSMYVQASIQGAASAPVTIRSHGPCENHKLEMNRW